MSVSGPSPDRSGDDSDGDSSDDPRQNVRCGDRLPPCRPPPRCRYLFPHDFFVFSSHSVSKSSAGH